MTLDAGFGAVLLLVGRLLFGGFLAFAGLNHFMNADEMSDYAATKGVPAAEFGVIASGSMLVLGGLGLLVGAYPVLAAGAGADEAGAGQAPLRRKVRPLHSTGGFPDGRWRCTAGSSR